AAPCGIAANGRGAGSMGRRLVPACLFRRWHAAGHRFGSRMPHRFAGTELGCDLRRGRPGARLARDARGGRLPGTPRRRHDPAVHAAFDRTPLDPGYIKGYLPGLRENGGQYTHAAVWCAVAWAAMGEGDRAGEIIDMLNPINHASTRAGVHAYK